jgi:hypothetical protein
MFDANVLLQLMFKDFGRLVDRYPQSNAFAVPMAWCEPRDHLNDCYFYMTKITGFSRLSKHKIKYPNTSSALRPFPHDNSMPVPKPPESYTLDSDSESEETSPKDTGPSTTAHTDISTLDTSEPHLVTQAELSDLIRDLDVSKTKAQLLGSRLKQRNRLEKV